MQLPAECGKPGMCAKLLRCLYGTRDAPARWEAHYSTELVKMGFVRGLASPCCFHHPERDIRAVVHGDDFTFSGEEVHLRWVQEKMQASFLCEVEGMLGPDPSDLKEVRLLNRVIRWGPRGVRYESDPRHAEMLIRD